MAAYVDSDEYIVDPDSDLQARQKRYEWSPAPKPTTIPEAIAEYRAVAARDKRAAEVRTIIARRRKRQDKKLADKWKKLREIQRRNRSKGRSH